MAILGLHLDMNKCPHCSVDTPSLQHVFQTETTSYAGGNKRAWRIYKCSRCGGLVTASSANYEGTVYEVYPSGREVDTSIPQKAKAYLEQALNSLHAPAGAVMLTASAVDAMLKEKGYKDGSLYSRIDQAAKDHLITLEMAEWAHKIRLDANDQRHADVVADLPVPEDARRCVDFALALGEFMFVLPSRVKQ